MKVQRIVANIGTPTVDDATRFHQQIFGLDLPMDHGWIATYGSSEKDAHRCRRKSVARKTMRNKPNQMTM